MLSILLLAITKQYEFDRVYPDIFTNLPYQHDIFAGYLDVAYNKTFFYMFFYSQTAPLKDPLLLWLNGGPGCSSLTGAFTQNGPFKIKQNDTQIELNPNAWNKKANVLYIQSPSGVGFSTGPYQSSDQSVAQDNLFALLAFYKKFPKFLNHDFFISGESYAGIYVPTLALAIHYFNNNQTTSQEDRIPLKGILVGNACTDPNQCYNTDHQGNSNFVYQYLRQRFYYSDQQWQQYRGACSYDLKSQHCQNVTFHMFNKFTSTKTSLYNIYGKCYQQHISPTYKGYHYRKIISKNKSNNLHDDLHCQDRIGILTLLNNYFVRKSIHASINGQWKICSDEVANTYIMNPKGSYWIYPILLQNHYKIQYNNKLIYSGDADACVPITGTIYWLLKMQQQYKLKLNDAFRPWLMGNVTGGMTFGMDNLRFVSIRKAGHMVPSTQPQLSWHMLDRFLQDKII